MSLDQIRAALNSIEATPRDGFLGELEDQLVDAWTDAVNGSERLTTLSRRSATMTLVDTESTQTQPNGRHRWSIVAAAAAVVAILIGALVLAARDEGGPQVPANTGAPDAVEPQVTTNTTVVLDAATAAEEVVRGFIDAYVASDAEQALTYLAADFIASEWGSPDDFSRSLAWNQAAGYKETFNGCEQHGTRAVGADVTVRCAYDLHGFGSEALGLGPYVGNYWELTVRDGKIVASYHVDGSNDFSDQVWGPFARWIKTEHADDVLVMYRDLSQTSSRNTDESLRLWEQRIGEYVQAVLTDRETYPADIAAICATQAQRLAELVQPADGDLEQVAAWNTAAATILRDILGELNALEKPPATDTTLYSDYVGSLIILISNLDAKGDAAAAGDTTKLADLDAERVEIRQRTSSGPAGSGLEECLASLPN
jgi:hypothetical protein